MILEMSELQTVTQLMEGRESAGLRRREYLHFFSSTVETAVLMLICNIINIFLFVCWVFDKNFGLRFFIIFVFLCVNLNLLQLLTVSKATC